MRYDKRYLTLFAVMALSACGRPSAPAQTAQPSQTVLETLENREAALIDRSTAYLEEFFSGQFGHFYEEAGEALKTDLPQTQAEQEWSVIFAQARAYRETLSTQAVPRDGKTEVQLITVHARYNLQTTFVYGEHDTVEALSFQLKPLIVIPQSNERWEEIPITLGYDPDKPLNGMLTLPEHVQNPPIAILVHGSGPQGMDSLIGAADNRPFADLAHGLADRGIASIRYDKRSYVYPEDVTDIETEYLYDVKDAVRFAMEEPRVDGDRLYLIGHSQGGMLSPKLAQDNPEFKGLVSLGGTLRRMEDIILEQHETMMAQDTTLTEEEKNSHISQIKEELQQVSGLSPESPDDRKELLLGYPVSYWISLNAIDSKKIAGELTIPMLILQGDNDFQVLYRTDFMLWQEVLKDRENVSFHHYPGLSHVFMPGSLERFDSSSYDPPANMDAQVIEDIAEWIQGQP